MLTKEEVIEAIRPVQDPDIGFSIVDLGLLRDIIIEDEGRRLEISMTLTSPACPIAPQIIGAVKLHAEMLKDVEVANVHLVWSPPWDPRRDATDDVKWTLGIWD